MYIRTASLYYGIWLVKDIPVDRIIAEKIKEVLNADCDVYDDKMPLRLIPDVNLYLDEESVYEILDQDEEVERNDMESISDGIDEVKTYMLAHPQQIDVQCLMSVVTDTGELYRMSKKAASLDEAIDKYTVTEECRNLDPASWRKLFNGWVMVKAFSYVTERIITFVNEYRDRSVGDATDALNKMLPFISYALVERNVRIALRQMILEGRVYEFELSNVRIADTLRKAADNMRCISFAEAKAVTKEELLTTIKNDKRPIPLPDQLHIKGLLEKISFICMKGDTIFGAIFVSKSENSLVLNFAYTVDKFALAALVVSAFDEDFKLYGPKQQITIPVLSDKSAEVIETLVPKVIKQRLVAIQQK